jgi:hypothetical protein
VPIYDDSREDHDDASHVVIVCPRWGVSELNLMVAKTGLPDTFSLPPAH